VKGEAPPESEVIRPVIVVRIAPTGIADVSFEAETDLDQDECMLIWPLVREELRRLDDRLLALSE
jgi:hypothetical protein